MMREWAHRLLLTAVATLFTLLLVEAGARFAFRYLPDSVIGVIAHVRLWGITGPVLGPSWTAYCVGDVEFGARNLPNLRRAPVQFGPARYHLDTRTFGDDNHGFRGSTAGPPWDGVVVGDSFAFCHHVDYSDCWVHELEQASGLAIANLAVPATGSVSHGRYLESFGRALKPRLVIWEYWINDVRDDAEQIGRRHLPCPSAEDVPPARNWREVLKRSSIVANLAHAALARLHGSTVASDTTGRGVNFQTTAGRPLVMWPNEAGAPASEAMQSALLLTTGAIGSAARRTQALHGQFLLLLAPSNVQAYAGQLTGANTLAELQAEDWMSDQILAYATDNDIPALDLRPAFRAAAATGADLYPSYDVHWTPAGNALVAREIMHWLKGHQ